MTRIEQIEQAAKTQRAVSLERAFVAGAIWADQSRDIDKIESNAFHRGQQQMKDRLEAEVRNFTLRRWGVGEHDVNEMIRYIFGTYNDEAQYETALDNIMGEPMKDVETLINTLHQ